MDREREGKLSTQDKRRSLTIARHPDATGTDKIGTGSPSMNHLTHPFTPQLAPTDRAHVDVQFWTMYEPGIGSRNSGDVCYTSISGMSAELARGAASESSTLGALVGGSRATQDMQMIGSSERDVASFLPSTSTFDLTGRSRRRGRSASRRHLI